MIKFYDTELKKEIKAQAKKHGFSLARITSPNSTQLQSDISNASRIVYYLAVQNLVFYGLQQALFAMMFDEDEVYIL